MLDFTCGASHRDDDPKLFGRCTFSGLVGLAHRPTDLSNEPLGTDGSTRTLKEKAHWLLPSNCPTKRKDDVVKHGNYCLLVADLDEGNFSQDDIAKELKQREIESFIIYDTLSSTETDRRHRVVIELASTLVVEKWIVLQRALMYLFDADKCTLKPNQISYMPTLSARNKSCYTVTYSNGQPLDPDRSVFALEAKVLESEQPENLTKAPKRYKSPPSTFDLNSDEYREPIGFFNQVAQWGLIFSVCGFKEVGNRLLPPTSKSGVPGAIISYKSRSQGAYFSCHTSDPLSDGLPHDKFDVWMVHGLGLDHRNPSDVVKACKEFASQYKLPDGYTLEQKNRYVYATQNKQHTLVLAN
ncbi:hypothetical protein KY951_001338 [Vibrio parahaemolyticus]|nr:hypothetical protein [Vibrio parahaemolyticus]EHU5159168.1 hypothetical protein [Vibrio parahaemolyticus]EKA7364068.1 hypothetical protein [Vibrio parahaemolyticus]